jgi:DNA-binding NarL/FixJ family response regulator
MIVRRFSPAIQAGNPGDKRPIRVLLGGDRPVILAGLRSLLLQIPGMTVIGAGGESRAIVAAIGRRPPDVVVLDAGGAGPAQFATVLAVRRRFPRARVLVLLRQRTRAALRQAARARVNGCLANDFSVRELAQAVRTVAAGRHYFPTRIQRRRPAPSLTAPADLLTPRQQAVLRLIAEGQSTKQVADSLHLGVKTVESHRTRLMHRLDIHEVAGLVRYAVRVGLVAVEG